MSPIQFILTIAALALMWNTMQASLRCIIKYQEAILARLECMQNEIACVRLAVNEEKATLQSQQAGK